MRYLLALVLALSICHVSDAKGRRLFARRAVAKQSCTRICVPACGSYAASAAPVEVIVNEVTIPAAPAVTTQAPIVEAPAVETVPTVVPQAIPAPVVTEPVVEKKLTLDEILGTNKPKNDNSPVINFKLK